MKSATALLQTSAEATLTVLTGPDKGSVYRLVSSKVRLGRGPENDIVITEDPQVSRHHAEIVTSNKGFEIRDLTQRNSINVDGKDCKSATLKDVSTFTLGETKFRFNYRTAAPTLPAEIGPHNNVPAATSAGGIEPYGTTPGTVSPQTRGMAAAGRRRPSARSPSSPIFKFVVVGVIGLVVWLVVSEGPAKKGGVKLRTEQQISAEVEVAQKLKEAAEKSIREKTGGDNNVAYQQAQEAYVKGFRDYKKGQYERAQDSFQACLSLYPAHTLCTRYLRQAQRKFNELVQYHMVLGRKYKDQNQFAACRAAFRNVMFMVKDPNSSTYKEAKANHDACAANLEERF